MHQNTLHVVALYPQVFKYFWDIGPWKVTKLFKLCQHEPSSRKHEAYQDAWGFKATLHIRIQEAAGQCQTRAEAPGPGFSKIS